MPGNYVNRGLRRTKAEMQKLDEQIQPLYERGLGSRSIGHLLDENPAVVYKRIRTRGWNRSRSEAQIAWQRQCKRRVKPKHGLKDRARLLVHKAVRTGKLIQQPCEECGETQTEAHHDDLKWSWFSGQKKTFL